MELSLFQYSQLSCIATTLILAFAMIFIGNRKARTLQWLFLAKWAITIVLALICGIKLMQFIYHLVDDNPKLNIAINMTMLFATTFSLVIAFFPAVFNITDKWNRMRLTMKVFIVCCALVWIGKVCPHPLDDIILACSIALFLFELSRITTVFAAKYRELVNKNKQQHTSEELAHLSYLNFLAQGVIFLSLFSLLYAVLALWSQNSMAIFNFASLLLWVYLFAAIVNVIINYIPDEKPAGAPSTTNDAETIETNQIPTQDATRDSLVENKSKSELSKLVISRLEKKINTLVDEKFYCTHGITMDSMAQQLNTNRSYLSRYINTTYGCSFNTWLTQLRIDEATRLLVDSPTLPMDKIALMVGFSSRSHFMSLFKASKGVTPGAWREQHAPGTTE